ncbi:MAG: ABC transporter permease [Actinobacteria bacterium]|nr:ABC transporter permease [Actinomycetota bacterium]
MGVLVVLKKELKSYLTSPLAYVLTVVYLALGGYIFSVILLTGGVAGMDAYFHNMSVILMFLVPVLTMRLWAEEEQKGTSELLMTVPISTAQVVLGKYFAAVALFGLILLITAVYPSILFRVGSPDTGALAAGYLGFFLVACTYLAAGFFASSLTRSQVIAAVTGFCILLALWVINWAAGAVTGLTGDVLRALSVSEHFKDFTRGVVDTTHIAYYLSAVFIFLYLAVTAIEKRNWS